MFQKECESLWAGAVSPEEFAQRVDEQANPVEKTGVFVNDENLLFRPSTCPRAQVHRFVHLITPM